MLKITIQKQSDNFKNLIDENEKLQSDLKVKTNEYIKLLQETRDTTSMLNIRANKGGAIKHEDGFKNADSDFDEIADMKNRI
jgi:hypothetical protein